MGLPSARRMTKPGEFAMVRQQGRARSGRLLTLALLSVGDKLLAETAEKPSKLGQGPLRFGFTLTKRLGNAVKRNFLRRRLREIARAASPMLEGKGMLVTIPRPIAVKASFQELASEWNYLAGKLDLLPRGARPTVPTDLPPALNP
jgi:ribonuclease P protein component